MSENSQQQIVVLSQEETRRLLEQGRQLVIAMRPLLEAAVRVRPEDLDFRVR